jgi:hypothetical protein
VLQFHEVSIGVWCVIFKLLLWRFLCNFRDIFELLCAVISQGSQVLGVDIVTLQNIVLQSVCDSNKTFWNLCASQV